MSRARRLLALLACAASACALSAPSALAAPSNGQGVVLTAAGHTLRLVDRGHRVADVHVASAHGLRRGDVVGVRKGRARAAGHVRRVSFLARVVRSSQRGAVVRLDDGSALALDGGQHVHGARAHARASVDFKRLTAGETVLVTLAADAQGNVALKLEPRTSSEAGGDRRGGSSGGDDDESDPGDDGYDDGDEVDGTVTAIAPDASSLTVAPDDGGDAMTIPVGDASLLDGIAVGDDVAVTLDDDGTAIDVEPIQWVDDPGDGSDDGDDE
jgi:hypothetical protein